MNSPHVSKCYTFSPVGCYCLQLTIYKLMILLMFCFIHIYFFFFFYIFVLVTFRFFSYHNIPNHHQNQYHLKFSSPTTVLLITPKLTYVQWSKIQIINLPLIIKSKHITIYNITEFYICGPLSLYFFRYNIFIFNINNLFIYKKRPYVCVLVTHLRLHIFYINSYKTAFNLHIFSSYNP